jgi:preprotein translocase subunit YajC
MVIIVYFVVIALAFFLLIVLPQRRRATAHRALVESLGVDDEVVTIGGVFGTIRAVDNDRIELEVAPGVLITVARNAIAQAANPAPPESPDPSLDEHPADNGTGDD